MVPLWRSWRPHVTHDLRVRVPHLASWSADFGTNADAEQRVPGLQTHSAERNTKFVAQGWW
jgi:hypothetical protein